MDDSRCTAEINVSWSKITVKVRWPELFRAPRPAAADSFIRSMLGIGQLKGVALDGQAGIACLDLLPGAPVGETLRRLAVAAKREADPYNDLQFGAAAVRRLRQPSFRLFRHRDVVSTWELLHEQPGRVRLRHELLRSDPLLPRRIDAALESVQGVEQTESRPVTGTVLIHFDPAAIDTSHLLRLLDEALEEPQPEANSLHPAEIRFGMANGSLALAAVGEFALPQLLPASAVLLLVSNVGNFRDAWRQMRRRRMGLPLLYSAIVIGTLGTGQFLAAATMSWLLKFWHRQYAWRLTAARRRLFEPLVRRQPFVNLVTDEGLKPVRVTELSEGEIVQLKAGEKLPIGGEVLSGYALVDERLVRGTDGLLPKSPGDQVFAASTVVVGNLEVKVTRSGLQTRIAALSQAMVAALTPARGELAPSADGERFGQQAVAPTLATAGLGLLVGDVTTAATILRPDYATGPGLAVPLETLASVFVCAHEGIVVRDMAALDRLADADLILLDCRAALDRTAFEVADVSCHSDLAENELLRLATTALARIDDERAQALIDACRRRGIGWSAEAQLDIGPGVTIYEGGKRVSVIEQGRSAMRASVSGDRQTPLTIVVDGAVVGSITFKRSKRRPGRAAIKQLRAAGAPELGAFFDRSGPEEISRIAGLGIDVQIAAATSEEKAAFLSECRKQDRKVAVVGEGQIDDELQRQAHVCVVLADDESWQTVSSPLVLLQPRLSKLVALWNVVRARRREVGVAQRYALVPNLFCVAGAFFFGFTSLAAVAMTNVGTFASFRRAHRRLSRLEASGQRQTDCPAKRRKAGSGRESARGPAQESHATYLPRCAADPINRIEHLPKEVGTLLISVGVAGMMLPGLIGAPALVAGGLVLWPGTFGKLEDWLQRRHPVMHRKGVKQMSRYLSDLEKRYPQTIRDERAGKKT